MTAWAEWSQRTWNPDTMSLSPSILSLMLLAIQIAITFLKLPVVSSSFLLMAGPHSFLEQHRKKEVGLCPDPVGDWVRILFLLGLSCIRTVFGGAILGRAAGFGQTSFSQLPPEPLR